MLRQAHLYPLWEQAHFLKLRCKREVYYIKKQHTNTVQRVKDLLAQEPTLGSVNAAYISKVLCISKRTLFRRLRDRSVSFQALLNAERRRRIVEEKLHLRLSPEALALALGYSDPKSFYRSFRDWMPDK